MADLRTYACRHGTAHGAADLEGLLATRRIRWVPTRGGPAEGHFIDVEIDAAIAGCLLAYYLKLRRRGGTTP